MTTKNLTGKTAIITGASKGIGRAIALALASEGVNLLLTARSKDILIEVKEEVERLGSKAHICEVDLSVNNAPEKIISDAIVTFGGIDILINNAGIAEAMSITDTSLEAWEKHMNLNARAPFLLSREAIPYLKESNHATIINIASIVASKGYINQGAYTASKHALIGFTKVLAQEVFEDDIRVHVISPGGVETEMITKTRPDLDTSILMTPDEVADIILFLLKHRGNAVIDEINVRRFSKTPWQ